jgi:Ketopantoate hydroxymethyltransferase
VLVSYDVLGLFDAFAPPFAKQYAQLGQVILSAAKDLANDVREGLFPKSTPKQTSDLAGRRLIPSLNDRTFEELKGPCMPVS